MTKLCPRGKAAAKRKFKVYPSAYANAYASKICAGKIKDPSGVKRKDFRGPKPSGAKVGMAVTAGSQSAMGRLQKSGIKKMMSGGFGIFGKKKKEEEKKSVQEENANKKKKRLEELRKEIGAKKGKMMIMIAVGKPVKKSKGGDAKIKKVIKGLHKASALHKGQAKSLQTVVKKAKEGLMAGPKPDPKSSPQGPGPKAPKSPIFPKKKKKAVPGDPNERREYLRNLQNPKSEYDKKGKLKYTFANKGKIMQVANKLEKASKAHAGQAKTLKSLKLSRGGGAAIRGTNFKGVF